MMKGHNLHCHDYFMASRTWSSLCVQNTFLKKIDETGMHKGTDIVGVGSDLKIIATTLKQDCPQHRKRNVYLQKTS